MWYFALGSVVLTPEISFMTLNQGRIQGFFIRGEGIFDSENIFCGYLFNNYDGDIDGKENVKKLSNRLRPCPHVSVFV